MSWGQLLNIYKENQRIREEEEAQGIIYCPVCLNSDLQTNSRGITLCPWCGWKS